MAGTCWNSRQSQRYLFCQAKQWREGQLRSLSGKAMGGGMKLEKALVSGLSWWAGVQDTALQALSFPSRVTVPPCHPHPPLSCPHTPSSPVVHRAPSPKQWQGAWCNNPAHRPPKSAPADHLVVEVWGEVASMCGGMDWALLPLPYH